ncbi:hypothetical protein [Nostoc sp.]|uniref:hypothetical protein n=1 Tax=Nostoc sp. TaxID=1180 RepID=UPI002FF564FB
MVGSKQAEQASPLHHNWLEIKQKTHSYCRESSQPWGHWGDLPGKDITNTNRIERSPQFIEPVAA